MTTEITMATTKYDVPAPTIRVRAAHSRITLGVVAACVLFYIATMVVVPEFATLRHLSSTLNLASILGIVAIGSGIVIINGGIDLSVANVITAAGVLASSLTAAGWPPPVIILAGLVMGALVGLINGTIVAGLRVPPLIVTLAVGGIVQGIQLVATGGTPQAAAPPVLQRIANDKIIFGLTGSTLVWLVLTILLTATLVRTRLGRTFFATGTNVRAAELAGLAVHRTTVVSYVLSGTAAATTGLLLLGYTGISSSTVGDGYLLPAIAAVVLGGVSILGGRGSAIGIAAGVILLTVLQSLLTVIDVSSAARQMLQGAILLIVMALYSGRVMSSRR